MKCAFPGLRQLRVAVFVITVWLQIEVVKHNRLISIRSVTTLKLAKMYHPHRFSLITLHIFRYTVHISPWRAVSGSDQATETFYVHSDVRRSLRMPQWAAVSRRRGWLVAGFVAVLRLTANMGRQYTVAWLGACADRLQYARQSVTDDTDPENPL